MTTPAATSLPCNISWSEDEPGTPKLRPFFASSVLLESSDSVKTKSDIAVKTTLNFFATFFQLFAPYMNRSVFVAC